MKNKFLNGATFGEYVEAARHHQELWKNVRKLAQLPDGIVRRVEDVGGRWHLLVISEDWCGDAVNTVPVVAALADAVDNLDLRIVARDQNPELMDVYLTNGSRSIPVVILLDEQFRDQGWWGPRPRQLQRWVLSDGKQLPPPDRYREIRRWYARDRGLSTLEEVVSLLEDAAGRHRAAVA